MQNIIKDQENFILEIDTLKIRAIEELEDVKAQLGFKNEQLNEWKEKYEVCIMLANQKKKKMYKMN